MQCISILWGVWWIHYYAHRTIISEAHMDKSIATCVCTHNTKSFKREIVVQYQKHHMFCTMPKASKRNVLAMPKPMTYLWTMKYYSAVQCSIYFFLHSMGRLFQFVYCICIVLHCIILNCITVLAAQCAVQWTVHCSVLHEYSVHHQLFFPPLNGHIIAFEFVC